MKQFIAIVTLTTMMTTMPVHAYAQDASINLPDVPEAVLTPMEKGDIAPFQGVLLSPDAIANIIADYRTFGEKIKIELEHAKAEANAQHQFELGNVETICNTDKKVLWAKFDDSERRNKILEIDLKKREKSDKNVMIWTVGGIAFGAIITSLGFAGYSYLTK